MRKMILWLLTLSLLLSVRACPAALAAESASARTSLSGSSENKLNNIHLAMGAVNGMRVAYGETFSFNDVVGARTQARGYRSAANGRGVNVTGGGVSQVATTLYLALLEVQGSVRFDELSTYGGRFKEKYVSDGSLAVITDYSAGTDFRFTNYASDMLIEMWTNGSYLYCDITLGDGASEGGWFDGWITPEPTAQPAVTQTIAAGIPFGDDEETAHNVRLAAGSIYDTTLGAGDVFSFNGIVGPRTSQYGYISATNGRGVRVTGGGVAQVASVIWLAVKNMEDIAILEKSTYGKKYNQHYVDSSADAIVTDYKAGRDFSFRYTGSGTITLYTYVDGNALRCDVVRNP